MTSHEICDKTLPIARYHSSQNFALSDGPGLVVLAVYKRGAEAVRQRLEADARTIDDLQCQIAELEALTPRFRAQATQTPYSPSEQLPLLAAKPAPTKAGDIAAYRPPARRKPAPRR